MFVSPFADDPSAQACKLQPKPLCVDLDGTLILSDMLIESLLLLIKHKPHCLFLIPFWLLRGRAVLKAEVAARVTPNLEALPYNHKLIRWLESERDSGRELWLCTASNQLIAKRVADHLKIFVGILASDGKTNLAGTSKAARLVERFGDRGFDYCGNEKRDVAIWRHAHGAIIVSGSNRLEREVARHATVLKTFPHRLNIFGEIICALRPHQWTKNMLLFVPLLTAHLLNDIGSLASASLGAIAFCFCASSVYVLNDLLDLEADRAHARKSKRPFAAGHLSILVGLALIPALLGPAVLIAMLLPSEFQLALLIYYILTVIYSFALKGIVLVDVLTLAILYTLRIVAGAAAISVTMSFWLLWFSMFLFLSLAFVKRYAELRGLHQQRSQLSGRDYAINDLLLLQTFGATAGYLSIVILALYINSPEINILYRRPAMMWLLCVMMLYWISFVWLKAQRGEMHDDPVVFALENRTSRLIGACAIMTIILAI